MRELRDFINEPPLPNSKSAPSSATGGLSIGSGASGGGSALGSGGAPGNGKGSQNGQGGGTGVGSAQGKANTKVSSSSYIDTDGLDAAGFPPAIGLILAELSSINVNRFPNATFDLLRTFLEKSIKAYAAKLKVDIKNTANLNSYVQLSHALTWLEQHLKSEGQTSLIQVVQKIRSGKISDFIPSKTHLDAINHNHLIFATPGDVRECWNTMKPLLQFMLVP